MATLGDRLEQARARRFVGRAAELAQLADWVTSPDPEPPLLFLHGPGGVGKTTLLHALHRLATSRDIPVVHVDLGRIEPRPVALLEELDVPAWRGTQARALLLLDTAERAAPLDGWLREVFVPSLPVGRLVVISGRNRPAAEWLDAPGWQDMVRVLHLRNLAEDDAAELLRAWDVDPTGWREALARTYGHPLAVCLLAEVLRQDPQAGTHQLQDSPDLLRRLVGRFLEDVPTPVHRQALQVCAHAWLTTEGLLREALPGADAGALFGWLQERSFVESSPNGVFPHDIARDVLDADLRLRDPSGYADQHRRIQRAMIHQARHTTGREQQRMTMGIVHAHRNSPMTAGYFEYGSLGQAFLDPVAPEDHAAVVAMVRRHLGPLQASLTERWLGRPADCSLLVRTAAPTPGGFFHILQLDRTTPDDRSADPGVAAAWDVIDRRRPLRPGDEAFMMRWVVDAERGHGPSRTLNLGPVMTFVQALTHPRITWDLLTFPDDGQMDALMAFIDFARLDGATHAVGDTRYAVFGRDHREVDLAGWLDVLAERELGGAVPATTASEDDLALPFPAFAAAVRQALKDLQRPDRLTANPLLRSRLVRASRPEDADPAAALVAVMREAADGLAAHPRDDRLRRALDRTYLRPAPTQEAAAEVLGLPFSTYRRHLGQAVDRLVEVLWQRELR